MSGEIQLSAKFKHDYVAFSAVAIFCLIVVSEIALAISIPAYLTSENAMALQVQRLRMLDTFDSARHEIERSKNSEEKAVMELRLIGWHLNLLSIYLRENSGKMSGDEIARVSDSIQEFERLILKINQGGAVSEEFRLDPTFYLNSVELK